nr:citrate lyase holo-[acyl-carrier protein] synthase [Lactobacillus xujianguonis]
MMKSIFDEGKEQGIPEVLAAKDKRVAMQKAIFAKYPDQTLVDVNLNIPGPIKNNQYLEHLFNEGIKQLVAKFEAAGMHYHVAAEWHEDTGAEIFYVLQEPIKQVKVVCVEFEDQTALGRSFDADVLVKDESMAMSRKDLGLPERKCFLCSRPAKECARSRRHSVAELQDYISQVYFENVK